jgi:acyl-CoA thioesterase
MAEDGPNVNRDKDQAEHEHISTALEVELLDVNLFRSKSLWLPTRARGVFGGQVISQALVSATKCVDAAFSLHVGTVSDLESENTYSMVLCSHSTYVPG